MKLEHINNIVQGLVHPNIEIMYGRYTGIDEPEPYYFIWFEGKTYHFDKEDMDNTDKMIQHCWAAIRPKWVSFTDVCGHSIGDIVYVDKTTPIAIESILQSVDGIEVISTVGNTYNAKNLWVKK